MVDRKPTGAGPFLRTQEAAEYCGYSAKHFARLRADGLGPAFCKAGRIVRYTVRDLDAWVLETRRAVAS